MYPNRIYFGPKVPSYIGTSLRPKYIPYWFMNPHNYPKPSNRMVPFITFHNP